MALRLTVKYKSQQGAALLIFMLILVMASSYSLLSKMNAATKPHLRLQVTSKVLAEAKQVLIGYALTYPENNAGFGPGYLPCPDRSNNGFINAGACASSTGTTIGRFPWRSLGVREMIDSSGARLWYVLSDNYRNNPKINDSGGYMNSDNAGQLTLDGVGDIVALIISPGEPVGNQNRDVSEFDIPDEIANYLEGENADIDAAYDVDFVTSNAGDFNDKVIAITRQELMAAIEKRVLGDVEDVINNYQIAHAVFPWLSPFSNPSTSTFRGAINTWQGHIPFHWANDPDSIEQGGAVAGRNPFLTDPTTANSSVGWNIATNSFIPVPTGTITAVCLNNINCNDGLFPQITELPLSTVFDCTWTDKATADCSTLQGSHPSVRNIFEVIWPTKICIGTVTRNYTLNFPSFIGDFVANPSTTSRVRTRNVFLSSIQSLSNQANAITITDVFTETFSLWAGCTASDYEGTGTLDFDSSTGVMAINGIQYDLNSDGIDLNADGDYDDAGEERPELPTWFVENGWQDLVYLAYASGEPLPGNTTAGQDCVALATPCISVSINGTAMNNVRAAVVSAGVDLTSGTARPNGTLSDYFDDDNNDLDNVIDEKRITVTYNDQTRIISTTP
jgi:hypothetical protein